MFAMCGKPIEMFGTVVHRMKSPKKSNSVLQTMAPVNKEIAEHNDFNELKPPWLRRDRVPEIGWDNAGHPHIQIRQHPENECAPNKILAKKKAKIGEPGRPHESLTRLGGKRHLERPKNNGEKQKCECSRPYD